jgi:hypothetical protein
VLINYYYVGSNGKKMYYKLLMLKFLPEIKEIESGKLKVLKRKEIDQFLNTIKN